MSAQLGLTSANRIAKTLLDHTHVVVTVVLSLMLMEEHAMVC